MISRASGHLLPLTLCDLRQPRTDVLTLIHTYIHRFNSMHTYVHLHTYMYALGHSIQILTAMYAHYIRIHRITYMSYYDSLTISD